VDRVCRVLLQVGRSFALKPVHSMRFT
jgi:hypothetical protein